MSIVGEIKNWVNDKVADLSQNLLPQNPDVLGEMAKVTNNNLPAGTVNSNVPTKPEPPANLAHQLDRDIKGLGVNSSTIV